MAKLSKKCSRCHKIKYLNEFYEDKRSTDGFQCCCRDCSREKTELYRKKYPNKVYESKKKWNQNNRERINLRARERKARFKEKDPINYYKKERELNNKWRLKNLDKVAWKRIKHSSFARKFDTDISFNEFKKLHWGKKCIYCGNIMTGLDRIDSNYGYKKNNVVPSCGRCNIMKFNLSLDEFLNHITTILKNKKNICQTIKKIQSQKSL